MRHVKESSSCSVVGLRVLLEVDLCLELCICLNHRMCTIDVSTCFFCICAWYRSSRCGAISKHVPSCYHLCVSVALTYFGLIDKHLCISCMGVRLLIFDVARCCSIVLLIVQNCIVEHFVCVMFCFFCRFWISRLLRAVEQALVCNACSNGHVKVDFVFRRNVRVWLL